MTPPPLDARRRALVALSAALGVGDREAIAGALERAASPEVPVSEVEEVLLQAYLFVGFPTVLNAFAAWREITPLGSPPSGAVEPADPEAWRARGERLCRRVYESAYDRLRENVRRLHPELDRWMVEEGYGKVLGRDGLGTIERELCIVALLAATGHAPQLRSHLRGALAVGAGVAEVEAALAVGLAAGARVPESERLQALWNEVKAR